MTTTNTTDATECTTWRTDWREGGSAQGSYGIRYLAGWFDTSAGLGLIHLKHEAGKTVVTFSAREARRLAMALLQAADDCETARRR